MMDYRYLKAFLLTVKNASFSKAASELNIAQSAVSRQIKLLEDSVGFELIVRSSKKVLLTQKGHELYQAAMEFDQNLENLLTLESQKTIKIGTLDGLVENWLNIILVRYYKKFNNNLMVTVDTPANLKKSLNNGELDLIFTTENIQNELISSLKLFDEELILISKKEIELSKVHESRWIAFNEEDNIFQAFKKSSLKLITVDSMTTILNLVKNGVGVAVVPDHFIKSSDNLISYPIKNLPKSMIYMATLSFKSMPQYLQEIIEVIQSQSKLSR
jgi:DNA-binding transcriptional LysR family regulator